MGSFFPEGSDPVFIANLTLCSDACSWSKPSSAKKSPVDLLFVFYCCCFPPPWVFRCSGPAFQDMNAPLTSFPPQAAGYESLLSPPPICFDSIFPHCFMYLLQWKASNKSKFFRWRKSWAETHALKGKSNYHHYVPLLPTSRRSQNLPRWLLNQTKFLQHTHTHTHRTTEPSRIYSITKSSPAQMTSLGNPTSSPCNKERGLCDTQLKSTAAKKSLPNQLEFFGISIEGNEGLW